MSGSLVTEMLTADHRGPGGATVYTSRNPSNAQLGTLQSAWTGNTDIMRIIGKSYQPVVYVGYRYSNDATGVAGWVTPILNGYVCYSGAPSGIVCGNKMTALSVSAAYGPMQIYFGLTRTSQVDGISAVGNGDSGGPVIAVADGKAYAMGVISGISGAPHTHARACPARSVAVSAAAKRSLLRSVSSSGTTPSTGRSSTPDVPAWPQDCAAASLQTFVDSQRSSAQSFASCSCGSETRSTGRSGWSVAFC